MPKFDFESQQPLFILTTSSEFKTLVAQGVQQGIANYEAQQQGKRRLTSKQAAEFLGCSVYHLQELHKRGLPYEKGRPNYYKLADLEAQRAKKRLG